MILVDTHVLVWLDEGSERLGSGSLGRINDAHSKGELVVSAISFWEVAMLVKKGRLQVRMALPVWRKNLLDGGLIEIPVSGLIGIRASKLEDFHGDPADGIITATALETSASLITADRGILAWSGLSDKQDARG